MRIKTFKEKAIKIWVGIDEKWKILLAFLLSIFVLYMASKFFNREVKPNTHTETPVVIEDKYKAEADYFKQEAKYWKSFSDSLLSAFNKSKPSHKSSKDKVKSAINNAISVVSSTKCDSVLSELNNINKEYDSYVAITDIQMERQGMIINAKDSMLSYSYSLLELEKRKFNSLASSYNSLQYKMDSTSEENVFLSDELDKTEKKLKRSKKVNSVTVPIIIVGATSIIAPQYTPYAVGAGAVLYFIIKPKKKRL